MRANSGRKTGSYHVDAGFHRYHVLHRVHGYHGPRARVCTAQRVIPVGLPQSTKLRLSERNQAQDGGFKMGCYTIHFVDERGSWYPSVKTTKSRRVAMKTVADMRAKAAKMMGQYRKLATRIDDPTPCLGECSALAVWREGRGKNARAYYVAQDGAPDYSRPCW